MKKSNKISIVYVLSSLSLLLVLIFGGAYGVYLSVGINFVRSSMSNMTDTAGTDSATNVAYGGTVNFESSMTGVIILSVALIFLAVIDIILLIRQIIFFKQFKVVREFKFEKNVEKKVKSKGYIIFFSIVFDLITFAVGVAGIFVNNRAFASNNISWVLYLIDGLVALFSLACLVLLIFKFQSAKKHKKEFENELERDNKRLFSLKFSDRKGGKTAEEANGLDIDELEYNLIKLKYLKSSEIISDAEYENIRNMIFGEGETKKEN